MQDLGVVERVTAPSHEDFHARYVAANRPVILAGLAAEWPAMTRWSGDALVANYGEIPVNALGRWTTVREVVDDIRRGTDVFADFVINQAPYLLRDIRPLPYVPLEDIVMANVWMGGARRTKLHYDLLENVHVVVRGVKKFFLIAPSEHARLYHVVPEPGARKTLSYTQLDFFAPDDARFPAARDVGYQLAELHPGDALYLPARWYHAVQHIGDPTLAINFWWPPRTSAAPEADTFFDDRVLLSAHYGERSQ